MDENKLLNMIDSCNLQSFIQKDEYLEYLEYCKKLFYQTQTNSIKIGMLNRAVKCQSIAKHAGFYLGIDWVVQNLEIYFYLVKEENHHKVVLQSNIELIRKLRLYRNILKFILNLEKNYHLGLFSLDELNTMLGSYNNYWFNGGKKGVK